MSRSQNSKSSWIDAGLSALVSEGSQALRAEPMAKKLKVTKGSFYWHFADVPAFHAALIDSWKHEILGQLITQLRASGTSEQRLRAFGTHVISDQVDPAMRAWASSNNHAHQAIKQIDEQRYTYISTLLGNLGLANPGFALACYGTLIGAPSIQSNTTPEQAFTALVDLILALK